MINKWLWAMYGHVYDGLRAFYPYQHLTQLVVDRITPTSQPFKVLDIGCGTGNTLQQIAQRFSQAKLYGAEPTPSMLRRARRKVPTATLQQQTALDYLRAQPPASADYIIMVNVLYALPNRAAVWRQVARVLAPQGRVIVTNSDRPGNKAIIREHLAHASRWQLLRPSLVLVGMFDALISRASVRGEFHFLSQQRLARELSAVHLHMQHVVRCYGGEEHGVNILFTALD